MSVFDEASSQRHQLGVALRELRQRAGMSGNALARRARIAQSKVSRVELGQQMPSADDLDRWLEETGAPDDRRVEIGRLREAAASEAVAWRRHRRRGLVAMQHDMAALEASAATFRLWHPTLVPGLLQTPAYTRAVYEAAHPGQQDFAQVIAARQDRQAILYDEGKTLEFVIGEPALRWPVGPSAVTLGQLDRLRTVAQLPNVTLAVLPLGEVTVWHTHQFTLLNGRDDGPIVHVELLAGGYNFRDPDDVDRYADAFKHLRASAIVGADASALLERVASEHR